MFDVRPIAKSDPTPLGDLPLERIEHEITVLAARITAGTCRWLELVAEFDRREGWGDWGCRSCAEWLAWQCSLTSRAAREHVRVARALAELPAIHAEFASGALSYSKVRALTRVATERSEEELLELARHATAAQLERIVRTYRRVSREEADYLHAKAYVNWRWEEDGSLSVRANLAPEDGALFLQALNGCRDSLWEERRAGGSAEPSSAETHCVGGSAEPVYDHPPTHAEALVALAETALARGPTPAAGGSRSEVSVHVDVAALADDERDETEGRCELDDGPGLARETARRLACDASVVAVLENQGEVLSVGRRTRSIPPAMRRALKARDGGCRFPGCEARRFVDGHHIRHWARGGETALDNLVLLCRHHHRLVHEGGYSLEQDVEREGELVFRNPYGYPLARAPALPARPPNSNPLAPAAAGLLTGTGERMDLGLCVDAVFAACTPKESDGTSIAPLS